MKTSLTPKYLLSSSLFFAILTIVTSLVISDLTEGSGLPYCIPFVVAMIFAPYLYHRKSLDSTIQSMSASKFQSIFNESLDVLYKFAVVLCSLLIVSLGLVGIAVSVSPFFIFVGLFPMALFTLIGVPTGLSLLLFHNRLKSHSRQFHIQSD